MPAQVFEEHAAVGERCVAVRGRGEEDDPHDHLRDVGEGTRDGDEEVLLRLSRVTDEGEPTERPEQDTFHRAPDPIRRPAVAELVDEDGAEQNRAVHEENHEAVLRATLQSALNKAQKRHHGDVNQEEPVDAQRDAEERAARVGSIHEAITLTQCGLLTLRGALRRGSGVVSAHRARGRVRVDPGSNFVSFGNWKNQKTELTAKSATRRRSGHSKTPNRVRPRRIASYVRRSISSRILSASSDGGMCFGLSRRHCQVCQLCGKLLNSKRQHTWITSSSGVARGTSEMFQPA